MKHSTLFALVLSTLVAAPFAKAETSVDKTMDQTSQNTPSTTDSNTPAAMPDVDAPTIPAADSDAANDASKTAPKDALTTAPPAPIDRAPAPVAAPAAPADQAPAARTANATDKPELGGDLRAPSPAILDSARRGYLQAGLGPAYGVGFESDSLMYNLNVSYNVNMNPRVTGKVLLDTYMGSGSVSSRMINIGVGADVFTPEINPFTSGLPYFSGEVALGNGRNAVEETATGVAIGAGAGFRFQAQELNWDISANYSLLSAPLGGTYPSIIGARAAVNF